VLRGLAAIVLFGACGFEHGIAQPSGDASPDATTGDGASDASRCGVAQLVAGAEHTCARTFDGSVYCWGRANSGELGVLPLSYRCSTSGGSMYYCSNAPRRVEIATSTALGAGNQHTCASTSAGTHCWGVNLHGAFGDGTTTSSNVPRAVPQRDGATLIEGGTYHTCSVSSGTLECSGQNIAGEVGDGTGTAQYTAQTINRSATTLSLSDYTSCVTDAMGQLSCWGRNVHAQIDGTAQNRLTPTVVSYVSDAVQVAAGRDHLCTVRKDQTAVCWGNNSYGQLGNGATAMYSGVVSVGVANVSEIAVSRHHGCVRDTDGAVWCFGEGYTPTPTKVALSKPAIALVAGAGHDCAITQDFEAWCWGEQGSGQLGNGVNPNGRTLVPQQARICP
jgi:alpha-tubulin suppressor-like RCC1 family protein